MINKKYYCDICDKYISNKSSHNKTKLHKQLSLSVVNKYYIPIVSVIEIDNIINKHIYDYDKKFHDFIAWCKIQNDYFCEKINMKWINAPNIKIQNEIISRQNCNQNDLVCIEIVFITDLDNATYNHYFQLPRTMLERKLCRIIDNNPNLIKTLDNMPNPYKRHIINKYWGIKLQNPLGIIRNYVPINWRDLEPNWMRIDENHLR